MIKIEFYGERKDGVKLYRTYSDEGLIIQKVGTEEKYDEAIDVEGAGYTYAETNELIESLEDENTNNSNE